MKLLALIPARSGSKRIPGKNIKMLNGYPLVVYTIQAAKDSGIFDNIVVSTDDFETARIAVDYDAELIMRPPEYATDESPDIEWITHALDTLKEKYDAFAILRPTSPFRTRDTIKDAFTLWDKNRCMKAVEPVSQHPAKMWKILLDDDMWVYDINPTGALLPTQSLDKVYVQNASLEFRTVEKRNGLWFPYQPFFTRDYEGFDLNTIQDWILAEELIKRGMATLPEVK